MAMTSRSDGAIEQVVQSGVLDSRDRTSGVKKKEENCMSITNGVMSRKHARTTQAGGQDPGARKTPGMRQALATLFRAIVIPPSSMSKRNCARGERGQEESALGGIRIRRSVLVSILDQDHHSMTEGGIGNGLPNVLHDGVAGSACMRQKLLSGAVA